MQIGNSIVFTSQEQRGLSIELVILALSQECEIIIASNILYASGLVSPQSGPYPCDFLLFVAYFVNTQRLI